MRGCWLVLENTFGFMGKSLKYSISPKIHSMIFKELNIEGYYHLYEVDKENVKRTILRLKELSAKGINVTIPYKTYIMEFLDDIDIKAKEIGSVNTICINNNRTIGYNTDYYGFGILLDKICVSVINSRAIILGSGGVAKSVFHYLVRKGAKNITIVSRDIDSKNVAKEMKEANWINYDELKNIKDVDIVVNCTPCGMYPNVEYSPVDKSIMSKFSIAIDLIYNPKETVFLKYANELNIININGLYMLIGQAVKSQELWNGIKINTSIIDKIYEQLGEIHE